MADLRTGGPEANQPKPTKSCPYCGEEILAVAIKCKHCHSDLSSRLVPSVPGSQAPRAPSKAEEGKPIGAFRVGEATEGPAPGSSRADDPAKNKKAAMGCLVLLALAGIIGAAFSGNRSASNGATHITGDVISRVLCESYIKKRLRDPSSGEFDYEGTKQFGDGRLETIFNVRASNGFGGKTLSGFVCTTTPTRNPAGDGPEDWTVASADETAANPP